MTWPIELRRKVFHHLSLVYLVLYAVLPRWAAVGFMTAAVVVVGAVEFLRLRRPEINAWFLKKFGGIHRPQEILAPSGIFWTLLGCWATIVVFESRLVIFPALGYLAFGDTAAALAGQKWGRRPWAKNPVKTLEGSAGFAAVSTVWGCFFLRPHVALLSALAGAWVESRPLPWNDNVWIPLLSGLAISVLNLLLGKS